MCGGFVSIVHFGRGRDEMREQTRVKEILT